jgi:hypothetical protein
MGKSVSRWFKNHLGKITDFGFLCFEVLLGLASETYQPATSKAGALRVQVETRPLADRRSLHGAVLDKRQSFVAEGD